MDNLSIVACVSKDMGLGVAGKLLWRIPEDMRFFKELTMGGVVVMGRKTFESIGNPLPGRQNVVLSRQPLAVNGVDWCTNPEELDEYLSHQTKTKYIIGGAALYDLYIDRAQKIYLTEVDGVKQADTFFPKFDKSKFERKVLQAGESDGIKYEIVEYSRHV